MSIVLNNLPVQLTSFIGRDHELAEIQRLLTTTRILTLIGSGRTGKTRLALRAADEVLNRFADGVWLVELAPLSDLTLIPVTIASVLGVHQPDADGAQGADQRCDKPPARVLRSAGRPAAQDGSCPASADSLLDLLIAEPANFPIAHPAVHRDLLWEMLSDPSMAVLNHNWVANIRPFVIVEVIWKGINACATSWQNGPHAVCGRAKGI